MPKGVKNKSSNGSTSTQASGILDSLKRLFTGNPQEKTSPTSTATNLSELSIGMAENFCKQFENGNKKFFDQTVGDKVAKATKETYRNRFFQAAMAFPKVAQMLLSRAYDGVVQVLGLEKIAQILVEHQNQEGFLTAVFPGETEQEKEISKERLGKFRADANAKKIILNPYFYEKLPEFLSNEILEQELGSTLDMAGTAKEVTRFPKNLQNKIESTETQIPTDSQNTDTANGTENWIVAISPMQTPYQQNHYEILGVDRNATQEAIKKKYRQLVLESHPDKNRNNPKTNETFEQIQEAHNVLKDPIQRLCYNHEFFKTDSLQTMESILRESKWDDSLNDQRDKASQFLEIIKPGIVAKFFSKLFHLERIRGNKKNQHFYKVRELKKILFEAAKNDYQTAQCLLKEYVYGTEKKVLTDLFSRAEIAGILCKHSNISNGFSSEKDKENLKTYLLSICEDPIATWKLLENKETREQLIREYLTLKEIAEVFLRHEKHDKFREKIEGDENCKRMFSNTEMILESEKLAVAILNSLYVGDAEGNFKFQIFSDEQIALIIAMYSTQPSFLQQVFPPENGLVKNKALVGSLVTNPSAAKILRESEEFVNFAKKQELSDLLTLEAEHSPKTALNPAVIPDAGQPPEKPKRPELPQATQVEEKMTNTNTSAGTPVATDFDKLMNAENAVPENDVEDLDRWLAIEWGLAHVPNKAVSSTSVPVPGSASAEDPTPTPAPLQTDEKSYYEAIPISPDATGDKIVSTCNVAINIKNMTIRRNRNPEQKIQLEKEIGRIEEVREFLRDPAKRFYYDHKIDPTNPDSDKLNVIKNDLLAKAKQDVEQADKLLGKYVLKGGVLSEEGIFSKAQVAEIFCAYDGLNEFDHGRKKGVYLRELGFFNEFFENNAPSLISICESPEATLILLKNKNIRGLFFSVKNVYLKPEQIGEIFLKHQKDDGFLKEIQKEENKKCKEVLLKVATVSEKTAVDFLNSSYVRDEKGNFRFDIFSRLEIGYLIYAYKTKPEFLNKIFHGENEEENQALLKKLLGDDLEVVEDLVRGNANPSVTTVVNVQRKAATPPQPVQPILPGAEVPTPSTPTDGSGKAPANGSSHLIGLNQQKQEFIDNLETVAQLVYAGYKSPIIVTMWLDKHKAFETIVKKFSRELSDLFKNDKKTAENFFSLFKSPRPSNFNEAINEFFKVNHHIETYLQKNISNLMPVATAWNDLLKDSSQYSKLQEQEIEGIKKELSKIRKGSEVEKHEVEVLDKKYQKEQKEFFIRQQDRLISQLVAVRRYVKDNNDDLSLFDKLYTEGTVHEYKAGHKKDDNDDKKKTNKKWQRVYKSAEFLKNFYRDHSEDNDEQFKQAVKGLLEAERLNSTHDADRPSLTSFLETNVNILLKHMANRYNRKKPRGALLELFSAGNNAGVDVIKLYIEGGADVNAKDENGWTPLHYAVADKNANPKVIRLLIEKGADPKAENNVGNTPLMVAIVNGQSDAVKTLIENSDLKLDQRYKEHLFSAAERHPEIAKILLSRAYVQLEDEKIFGREKIAEILVKHQNEAGFLKAIFPEGETQNNNNKAKLSRLVINQAAHTTIKQLENGVLRNFVRATLEPLHQAVFDSDINLIERLIKKGVDVNVKDINGKTPSHYAVYHNPNHEVIELLIRNGANFSAKDNNGQMPLDNITDEGVKWVVYKAEAERFLKYQERDRIFLTDKKNDLDYQERLFSAAKQDHEIAKMLLSGAYVQLEDERIFGREKIAEILVKHQNEEGFLKAVFPEDQAQNNKTKLDRLLGDEIANRIILVQDNETLRRFFGLDLLQNIPPKPQRHVVANNLMPLHHAVAFNASIEEINCLLQAEAKIDTQDHNGMTPLHLAAMSHNKTLFDLLILKGANPAIKDERGRTPRDLWPLSNDLTAQTTTSAATPSATSGSEQPNKNGGTRLHRAVLHDTPNVGVIKLFIKEKKDDVNAKDHNGMTPLHHAVARDNPNVEVIELLFQAGAEVDAKDHNGMTPLHHAVSRANPEVIKLLIQAGADRQELFLAAEKYAEIAKILLSRAYVQLEDEKIFGREKIATILVKHQNEEGFLKAVFPKEKKEEENNKRKWSRLLTNKKIHDIIYKKGNETLHNFINTTLAPHLAKDENGWTSLHHAVFNNDDVAIKRLLQAGANVNAQDKNGQTPLHLAVKHQKDEAFKLLIAAGADFKVFDRQNDDPLALANDTTYADKLREIIATTPGANLRPEEQVVIMNTLRKDRVLKILNQIKKSKDGTNVAEYDKALLALAEVVDTSAAKEMLKKLRTLTGTETPEEWRKFFEEVVKYVKQCCQANLSGVVGGDDQTTIFIAALHKAGATEEDTQKLKLFGEILNSCASKFEGEEFQEIFGIPNLLGEEGRFLATLEVSLNVVQQLRQNDKTASNIIDSSAAVSVSGQEFFNNFISIKTVGAGETIQRASNFIQATDKSILVTIDLEQEKRNKLDIEKTIDSRLEKLNQVGQLLEGLSEIINENIKLLRDKVKTSGNKPLSKQIEVVERLDEQLGATKEKLEKFKQKFSERLTSEQLNEDVELATVFRKNQNNQDFVQAELTDVEGKKEYFWTAMCNPTAAEILLNSSHARASGKNPGLFTDFEIAQIWEKHSKQPGFLEKVIRDRGFLDRLVEAVFDEDIMSPLLADANIAAKLTSNQELFKILQKQLTPEQIVLIQNKAKERNIKFAASDEKIDLWKKLPNNIPSKIQRFFDSGLDLFASKNAGFRQYVYQLALGNKEAAGLLFSPQYIQKTDAINFTNTQIERICNKHSIVAAPTTAAASTSASVVLNVETSASASGPALVVSNDYNILKANVEKVLFESSPSPAKYNEEERGILRDVGVVVNSLARVNDNNIDVKSILIGCLLSHYGPLGAQPKPTGSSSNTFGYGFFATIKRAQPEPAVAGLLRSKIATCLAGIFDVNNAALKNREAGEACKKEYETYFNEQIANTASSSTPRR